MVSNVANPIFGYLERFMIASILSVSTLTFYSAPYELVSKLLIFPMAIVPSLFPYFSYHGSKKSTEVSEVTSRTIKYLLLVFAPAIAIFFFFAHDIMQLWLGPTFAAQSTVVLQVITLVCVFNGLAYVPYTSVQALGRPDLKAIQDLVTLPVYAAFAWWFMHRYGINGAAFAKLVLTLIDCVLLYTFASRLKAFSFRDLISGPLFRAIVVSAALLAAVFLIRSSHVKLPVAAALTVFCFVVYAIAFWMVAVDEEDRNIISNIRHRVFAILPSRRGIASQTTGNRLNSLNARSTIDFMAQQAPLRITFLLPGYTWVPSGGFRVVYEYANQLVSLGHHVTVVHPRQLKFFSPAKRAIRERLHRARYDLMELFAIPAFDWHPIDERVKLAFVPTSAERYIPDADVLFATSWQTLQSVLRCSKVKGEKFYLIQGYETWMGPKDAVDQTWLSRTSKVVVARWLFDLGNSLGASNLTHIPNAVDHSRYRVIQPIPLRSRRVVMPISWVRIKGSADGIKALEIAKMKFPDLQVVLFGNSRRPSWIPGWMTHYDNPEQERIIEDLYNKSSIILSPSLTEGFPLPPAEGAACGCAIVATDIGGHREYVEDGVTGLLSPSGNPEALAENLCRLLGDDDLRIRLAYAASERMKQFSWKRSAALLEELVIGAVQGKSAEVRLAPVVPESALTTPLQAEGD
jgi:glycosyltransferase involved in cell wall biosynthesis